MKAPVNKIIPVSVVDGPGNRTAVFLQGCNISCAYCHNPETQKLCTGCGICVDGCPAGALALNGKTVSWDEKKMCFLRPVHSRLPELRLSEDPGDERRGGF